MYLVREAPVGTWRVLAMGGNPGGWRGQGLLDFVSPIGFL